MGQLAFHSAARSRPPCYTGSPRQPETLYCEARMKQDAKTTDMFALGFAYELWVQAVSHIVRTVEEGFTGIQVIMPFEKKLL